MNIFQFEAGDIVALRSGGPAMTVTAAERIPVDKPVDPKAPAPDPKAPTPPPPPIVAGPAVKCLWQKADGETAEGSFPAGFLILSDRMGNHAERNSAIINQIAARHAAEKAAAARQAVSRTAP